MNKRCFVFSVWTSMLVHLGECNLMFWERRSCPLLSPGLRFEPATFQSQTWLQSPKTNRSSLWWNVSSHAGFHADDDPLWRKTADYWNSCYTFMTELSSSSFKHDYSCLNYHNINVRHSTVFHRSSCESSEITFSIISIRRNCEITNYAKLNVHFAFSQINCAALWQTICIMLVFIKTPRCIHELGPQAGTARSQTAGKILARYLSCHWQPGRDEEVVRVTTERVIVICETVGAVWVFIS